MTYQPSLKKLMAIALVSGLSLAAVTHAAEEDISKRDPARWTQPDDTPALKAATMRKEAAAAYQMSLNDCKGMKGTEAADCKKQAKMNYDEEMKAAQATSTKMPKAKKMHKTANDMAAATPNK